MTAISLPVLTDTGLARYMEDVRKFPMLEEKEEYMLAKAWVEREDLTAAHKLVTSHLRLVVKIAMGFRGYGLPVAELISEGNIGLMQAVKKFDPEKGFRLSTYAMWWIRAAIQEYVLRSWSLVKMGTTAAQKKLFFNLRRLKHRIFSASDSTDRNLLPSEVTNIANELDVSERDVLEMDERLGTYDPSLNAHVGGEDGGEDEWMDFLSDESDNQEVMLAENQIMGKRRLIFSSAMKNLNERERDIIRQRKMQDVPATLEELSQKYEISRERVRQIENRAMEKLQAEVRSSI